MCKKIEFEKLGPEKSKNRAHRFWPKSPNSVHKKLKTDICPSIYIKLFAQISYGFKFLSSWGSLCKKSKRQSRVDLIFHHTKS